jgi:DNA-binding LytR/AlgR family response regulator
MINCLIIDDEPVARSIIRNYCSHIPVLNILAECGNALDAKDILLDEKVDLLFLDIHLPVLNGMEFLNTLKHSPLVIFTTAYEEYAVNAFNLSACDYLLKPFSLDRFIIAVDKVKERLREKISTLTAPSQDYFFIKSESKIFKIFYRDCLYAEAQGNYTRLVTVTTSHLTKMPFSTFIAMLPANLFIKVHRSFIINKEKISHIEGNRIFIMQKEVPLASNYREVFFKTIGL